MINRKVIASLILALSLMITMPVIHPLVQASGPPYAWTGPTDVSPHLGQDDLPTALQAANGTLWLAWQTFRFSNTRPDIIYQTLTNGVWSTINKVTSIGYNTSPALAQLSNGTIILFWSQEQTLAFNIYYERFTVNVFTGIGTWSIPGHLTTPTKFNDTAPAATVGVDGTLWLFFQRTNESCTTTCIQTKQLYYKTLVNGSWSPETQVTSDNNWNSSPSVVVTKDRLVRLAWSKFGQAIGTTLTSPQIYYKTYNGTKWSAETAASSPPSGFGDQHPSIIQDRNGTIWLFYSRTSLSTPQFVLFNKFITNNGQVWPAAETQMSNEASGVDDQQPWAVQANSQNDKTIHLFYASDRTNFDYDIWSLTSPPISPVHDLGITFVSPQPDLLYSGGMQSIGENSNTTVALTIVNYGDYGENARATVSVSNRTTISLGSQAQPVNIGGSVSFIFSWNTTNPNGTNAPAGRYNILVNAISTNGTETAGNLGDNSVTVKNSIRLLPWGDTDQDGNVNLQDVSIFVFDYGFTPATPSRWCAVCDIDNSGVIGLQDVSISFKNFGIVS